MLNFEDNECHSQRINTVKFYPDSDFNFYSGGWDKTVKFWSTKQKQPINQIHGV
jgi:WD40 repeat protein